MGTIKIPAAEVLKKIYGETEESSARYTNLAVNFEKKYHHDKAEFFTAPGRTEIIGNHVDHNGGQIIAASIDLDTIGAAYPNGTNVILSQSFSGSVHDRIGTEAQMYHLHKPCLRWKHDDVSLSETEISDPGLLY